MSISCEKPLAATWQSSLCIHGRAGFERCDICAHEHRINELESKVKRLEEDMMTVGKVLAKIELKQLYEVCPTCNGKGRIG